MLVFRIALLTEISYFKTVSLRSWPNSFRVTRIPLSIFFLTVQKDVLLLGGLILAYWLIVSVNSAVEDVLVFFSLQETVLNS